MHRRRVGQAFGAVLGAGALIAGCSAFSIADDGAAPTADAHAIDGAPEGDAVEGDASPTNGEDAASAGFCESLSPAPTFCVDFDDGEPPGAGFTEPASAASTSIDTLFFTSPPASLRIIGGSQSAMRRTLDEAPSSYEIRFQMRLGTIDGGIDADPTFLIPVRFETPDCEITLILADAGGLDVKRLDGDASSSVRVPLVRRPLPGVWSQVQMRLTRTPGESVIALTIDGRPGLEGDLVSSCPLIGKPRLWFGLLYADGVEARFDDLVVYSR